MQRTDSCIVVVGDSILDRYYAGSISRISSEYLCPLTKVGSITDVPGGAANVALNIAALGNSVHLVTMLGDMETDEAAFSIKELLDSSPWNVIVHAYHTAGYRIPIKHRVTDNSGKVITRFDNELVPDECPICAGVVDETVRLLNGKSNNPPVHCLVISDYAKGTLLSSAHVELILEEARRLKIPAIVDPKSVDVTRYCPASIITPNLAEAQAMLGKTVKADEAAAMLFDKVFTRGVDAILVTDGVNGSYLAFYSNMSKQLIKIPAYPALDVADATGAGDTVVAVLAHELQSNRIQHVDILSLLEESCRRASMGAGYTSAKPGTVVLTKWHYADILALFGRKPHSKLCTLDELLVLTKTSKVEGNKVVFTNGCFDMLHPGHVQLLQQARALGDLLIVAINTDEDIKKLKGYLRPFIHVQQRVNMLEALHCVDAVIVFNSNELEDLIEQIQPDFLVKGNDYRDKPIVGSKSIEANGGKICLIDLVEGYSTSNYIIAK